MEPGLTGTQSILSLFLQHLIISDILFHVYFGLGINSHSFCLGNRVYYLAIFFPSLVIVFISTTVNYSFLIILTPKEMVLPKVNIFIEMENYVNSQMLFMVLLGPVVSDCQRESRSRSILSLIPQSMKTYIDYYYYAYKFLNNIFVMKIY